MRVHRLISGMIAVCLFVAFTPFCKAQCEPFWDTTLGSPGVNTGYIQPMIAWNDGTGEKFYAGGSATDIGGSTLNDFLAQYDPKTGIWSRLGTGINQGSTNAFLTRLLPWDDGNGEKLYVIGQFASAGGLTSANSFAVWDGTDWSDAGAGFNQTVSRVTYDMLPADLGDGEKLYLGGNWSMIGGQSASGLAWFDGETFGVWGTGGGIGQQGGFSPFVAELEEWDDGTGQAIYACGRFLGIDNAVSENICRYNAASGAWEAFGTQLLPISQTQGLTSMVVWDDGDGEALYVCGGGLRVAGDPNVYLVAKWNGVQWTGIGQTLSGRATALEVWDDGNGPALYVTGTAMFEVNYFAKLVEGLWEPVMSGVNNPSTSGGFASAFGLYVWDDQLVVGGSFTQVGGFDPVTGAGMGKPIPARGIAAIQGCATLVLGDVNMDGAVTLEDVAPFVDLLVSGGYQEEADINQDGEVDLADVALFVELLTGV